jgi:hypothetical protein
MFLSETVVYGNTIGTNQLLLGRVLLMIIALTLGVIGLIAWFVIRLLTRKKNGS